jgi:hypothetical protein
MKLDFPGDAVMELPLMWPRPSLDHHEVVEIHESLRERLSANVTHGAQVEVAS